jgi:hypothetical protein
MRNGNWRLALLVMAVAVCAAGMLVNAGDDLCYNDVEVSGAGYEDADGTRQFVEWQASLPHRGDEYDGLW